MAALDFLGDKNLLSEIYAVLDCQDKGHTGKIHNAVPGEEKHYGMFVFQPDYSENASYVSFRLVLTVKSFSSDVPDGEALFIVKPGTFLDAEKILSSDFLTDADLTDCGWEQFHAVNDSSHELRNLEKTVYSVAGGQLSCEFVFNCNVTYIGFLIDPCEVSEGHGFEVEFNHVYDLRKKRPLLKMQPEFVPILSKDITESGDDVENIDNFALFYKKDGSGGIDLSHPYIYADKQDVGKLHEQGKGIKIKETDSAVNYSMQVMNVKVSDKGLLREIYGFNGLREWSLYPDSAFSFEKAVLKKLNVVTWSGQLVEWPWAALLWYGEVFFFADMEEFGECCRKFFKEHGNDACPVCGEPLGGQLKFSFIDVMRKPHQLFFCSHDCLKKFNANMMLYLKLLTKPNNDYLLGIRY